MNKQQKDKFWKKLEESHWDMGVVVEFILKKMEQDKKTIKSIVSPNTLEDNGSGVEK